MTTTLSAKKLLSVPVEMIKEVATGLEDGEAIAGRFGYTSEEWKVLSVQPAFVMDVNRYRSEFERTGQTFKLKAKMLAEELLANVFVHAMSDDVPVKDKTAALQMLAKYGELEPKTNLTATQGSGFSITINIPSVPKEDAITGTIEGTIVEEPEETLTLNFSGSGLTEHSIPEIALDEGDREDVSDVEPDGDSK